jgi:hypothetical protein
MLQTDPTAMLVGAALVVAVLVVLVAVAAVRRRRQQDFEVLPLPADRVAPFRQRLDELEALFVTRPRHAVAGARQLVDDMLALMGYPARLGRDDRVRDIAFTNRGHARRYRTAVVVDDRSTTEEMRRAMEHLLAIGRDLLSESGGGAAATREVAAPEPQPAGRPAGEPAGERSGERPIAG